MQTELPEDKKIANQIAAKKIKRTFYVDLMRNWLHDLDNEEISFSRFVEILNVEAAKNIAAEATRAQVLVNALSDIASGKVLPQLIAKTALNEYNKPAAI